MGTETAHQWVDKSVHGWVVVSVVASAHQSGNQLVHQTAAALEETSAHQ